MPPHFGHLALIDFAAKNCDHLTVALCSRPDESIPGQERYRWMKELMKNNNNIEVRHIRADLPQDEESSRSVSRVWSKYLLKRFGKMDIIFSSEIYGDYLAEYMNTKHKIFDIKRNQIKISGTKIRSNPFKCWDFIPKAVRPYFVKKICIYGPESTGKSTLTKRLAEYYNTEWVHEYARDYIAKRGNEFCYDDMEKVAKGHARAEYRARKYANKLLFCDTDAITTLVYSRHYFGKYPEYVKKMADKKNYDLYLFTETDIDWQDDPQRDLGDRRQEFKEIFKNELIKRNIPFTVVSGKGKERLGCAINAVENFLCEC